MPGMHSKSKRAEFNADAPDQLRVADFTNVNTAMGTGLRRLRHRRPTPIM